MATKQTTDPGFDPDHAIVISDSEDDFNELPNALLPRFPVKSPFDFQVEVSGQACVSQDSPRPSEGLTMHASNDVDKDAIEKGREVISMANPSSLPSGSDVASREQVLGHRRSAALEIAETFVSAPRGAELDASDVESSGSRRCPRARPRSYVSTDTSSDSDNETSGPDEGTYLMRPRSIRESTAERILASVCEVDVPKASLGRPMASGGGVPRPQGEDSSDELSSGSSDDERPATSRRDLGTKRHKPPPQGSSFRPESTTMRKASQSCVASPPPDDDEGSSVVIPKTNFARARRVLVHRNLNQLIVTVAMRGDIQFIRDKRRITGWSMPADRRRLVEDAIVVGDTVVVGYSSGPSQISLMSLHPALEDKKPTRIDLNHAAHDNVGRMRGDTTCDARISCLSALASDRLEFLSGGYDKRVVHWTIDDSEIAATEALPIFHSGPVHALAYNGRNRAVFSSSGRTIYEMNLHKPTKTSPIRKSTPVRHIHVHAQDPNLVLLEFSGRIQMKDLDHQIQIYDVRVGSFDRSPCLRFGRDEHRTGHESTRYRRGSVFMSYFCLGYSDGSINVWDFRHKTDVTIKSRKHRPAPIVHTALFQSDVLAYGGHIVTFWPA
ncbi:hypothetical protein GLOTRDRAFT_91139 [Gloeophyllum trabeum ATCC 11539]|uniref:WD40 repeat-like protein n=1 Tax=Gloeophyllum trabeum (strain ATCC 11539 / FP-39264 / Madison 617) TaxID=670483 RepID=S7S1G2_GLOTA|nr:uncharacterized protein GLOTRDRAFT_91139 [Gloeophyllum trabeum ATCC 11539]EPQ59589.1 hypothetical protein GLOTRDRAFT_91139 [Gloeophyllum trabeum ATCC 11539]